MPGADLRLEHDLNPIWMAQSKLRRRRFDECIELCTTVLERNPLDQAAWYLKCRALTLKNWIDDTEIEEEGIADMLLDEHNVAQDARPGTSLARPMTSAAGASSQAVRPMTNGGRPITGFVRPATHAGPGASRQGRGATASVEAAMKGALRPGTQSSRPVTSSGRFVRLGTASMMAEAGGPFINPERLDLRKYASRPTLSRALMDYILYVDHNVKRGAELAALAVAASKEGGAAAAGGARLGRSGAKDEDDGEGADWWWRGRLGKCYYQLGLLRDAERQFLLSLKQQDMVSTILDLCKIHLRLDQPNAALQRYSQAAEVHEGNTALLLGAARVHDALGDTEAGLALYKQVLGYDSSNIEAIACLAAFHFYSDQPEVALRYYRRLLQGGVSCAEIWNNLGLCCFYAGQYDVALNCFERALSMANDSTLPDVWYNIGQVALGIGDLGLAHQCFRITVSVDPSHAEAYNNLGVLELRKGNQEQARSYFRSGQRLGSHVFELWYNGALSAQHQGDLQAALEQAQAAVEAYPEHADSKALLQSLRTQLMAL